MRKNTNSSTACQNSFLFSLLQEKTSTAAPTKEDEAQPVAKEEKKSAPKDEKEAKMKEGKKEGEGEGEDLPLKGKGDSE